MAVKPHYFSRSAADADDDCPRKRFWNTIYGGRGVDTTEPKDALTFGTAIHKGVQEIWETGNIKVHEHLFEGQSEEMALIGRGLLFAYYTTVYQRYKQEGWKLLYTEKECAALLGYSPVKKRPLILLAQPDLLLQHESTGVVRYVEFKTTKLLTSDYLESWRYAPQLAAGFEAVWQTLGIQVDEFVMQLFYKGTYYKDEGRWASIFTSGWKKDSLYSAKRPASWKGWTRALPTDWMPEAHWHEICRNQDELSGVCPETAPMIFNKKMVENWLEYKRRREGEIADISEDTTIEEVFPQHFLKCRPVMGYACPFLSLCWNPMEEKNPLMSGKYMWRMPHHATEAEALNAAD
jgi:hypothetical protein